MKKPLNITNGDCAVNIMQKANIKGGFLPWRDVLHDGPVPNSHSLEELSTIRAAFITERGWGNANDIKKSFIERDNILKSFQDYEKVILWFEHDLYDQLQLIQILDWFYHQGSHDIPLSIICTDNYLGGLYPEEMLKLVDYEDTITKQHLKLAHMAWNAFRSDTPEQWQSLLEGDLTSLPFLKDAIIRFLEEYPSSFNGLSRTAMQALSIIADEEKRPNKVFELSQKYEERIYLGDLSFWHIIDELLQAEPPLLASNKGNTIEIPITKEQQLKITHYGKEVLMGKQHYLKKAKLNRWLGGTHLTKNNIWLWDAQTLLIKSAKEY